MLGRVVVENGVKKIVPLTADCGSGNPCGAIITVYQRTVPNGYLPLGAQYDITQFPVLYSILGTDTIPTASALGLPTLTTGQYVIKATSGINENQADNVLNILQPVDVVALNNVHSVTSNAVARELSYSSTTISNSKLTGSITIKKYGKIVNVQYNGDLKANQTFSDGELIATIPSDYKPSLQQRVLVRYYNASQQIWLTISSDGNIYFYGSMTAVSVVVNFQFFLTYII